MSDRGRIVRVTGSLVLARGVAPVRMNDVVRVGEAALWGEVIRLEGDVAGIQVFEDTTGLAVGEPAWSTGSPLTVELGPGLLGGVFDGIQRPLAALHQAQGAYLAPGVEAAALDRARRFHFEPAWPREVVPGTLLGTVDEGGIVHRILAPAGAAGVVAESRGGDLTLEEPVVILESGARLTMLQRWPVRRGRPHRGKLPISEPLLTGQRIFDTFFPLARGGIAVVPGGFGTGKTVIDHLLAKHADVDVIVVVGCGERGNEMTALLSEFPKLVDPRSGRPLLQRTVLVVNTSNMPVAAREASIYVGITIAEYFRDMGYHVAVMADSTSRWAEALREMGGRLGEVPGEEGYPPYLSTRLASFYERAGIVRCLAPEGEERTGSVSIVGAISPPGGDFSEPVTQASLRVAGALWALDPDLAHRRHFPAVSEGLSYSLYMRELEPWFRREVGEGFPEARLEAMRLLQKERELRQVVEIVGMDALPDEERLTLQGARLLREGFLQQDGFHPVDQACPVSRQAAMLELVMSLVRAAHEALDRGATLEEVLASDLWVALTRLREAGEAELPGICESLSRRILALAREAA